MADELEVQSLIFTASLAGIERVCKFFKVEFNGQKTLVLVKELCGSLENELSKLKEAEKCSYLKDVKELISEKIAKAATGEPKVEKKGHLVGGTSNEGSKQDSIREILSSSALRRQFKISGQVGEPDQKDKISFTSLVRQILSGQNQGYKESEIVDGVIRAISPGMVLRSYLETYKDLSLDRLKKILRSHYGVKNTTELYQSLAGICQGPKESPQAFLMNALDLRQQIIFACGEGLEDDSLQFDPEHIQRLFLRSVETGLQDESIRAKIRPFLKDPKVTDELLIQQMGAAMSAENERSKKLKCQNKSKANPISVTAVSDDPPKNSTSKHQKEQPSDMMAAINAIKAEVESLKNGLKSNKSNPNSNTRGRDGNYQPQRDSDYRPQRDSNYRPQRDSDYQPQRDGDYRPQRDDNYRPQQNDSYRPQRRAPPMCSTCQEQGNDKCPHCFKCGSPSHFARDCDTPSNGQRLPPRGRR